MRIRSIKPEYWRSNDVANLDFTTRLVFIGLWCYVDDNGVGIDDERLIAADLFALEDDQATVRSTIRESLATLARHSLIARYERSGKRLMFVTGWDRHQRVDKPGRTRYERPSDDEIPENTDLCEQLQADSRDSRESIATVSRLEQGNRGTGEQKKDSSSATPTTVRDDMPTTLREPFGEFWDAYPRRIGKSEAKRKFVIAARRAEPDVIIDAAKRYAKSMKGTEPQYVAHPATWLHQGRWEDEPPARTDYRPSTPWAGA